MGTVMSYFHDFEQVTDLGISPTDNLLYVGRYSSVKGNQIGIARLCPNDRETLEGLWKEGSVKSLKLFFQVRHSYYYSGLKNLRVAAVAKDGKEIYSPVVFAKLTMFTTVSTELINHVNKAERFPAFFTFTGLSEKTECYGSITPKFLSAVI